MHNMTICICTDSETALLALSSYTTSSKLLHQSSAYYHKRVRLFEEADRLVRVGSYSHFCGPESCVPLSASVVWDMNFYN
jgi:hypothetical protein